MRKVMLKPWGASQWYRYVLRSAGRAGCPQPWFSALVFTALYASSSFLSVCSAVYGAGLQLEITPKVAGEALQPASLRYQTTAGETFSITRVSYLLSDFALQRADGSWLEFSNSVAWFDFEQNRNSFRVDNVPPGEFRSVRFSVGLNTNLNHADVA